MSTQEPNVEFQGSSIPERDTTLAVGAANYVKERLKTMEEEYLVNAAEMRLLLYFEPIDEDALEEVAHDVVMIAENAQANVEMLRALLEPDQDVTDAAGNQFTHQEIAEAIQDVSSRMMEESSLPKHLPGLVLRAEFLPRESATEGSDPIGQHIEYVFDEVQKELLTFQERFGYMPRMTKPCSLIPESEQA